MSFKIEEADSDDIDGMNELFAEEDAYHRELDPGLFRKTDSNTPPRAIEDLMGLIESESACLLVARSGDGLVGLASVSLTEQSGHLLFVDRTFAVLEDLIVQKKYRRHGVGTALIRHAERWATSKGATALELGVWPSNEGARRFYERLGYVPCWVKMRRSLGGD